MIDFVLETLDGLERQGVIGAFDKRTIIDLSGDVQIVSLFLGIAAAYTKSSLSGDDFLLYRKLRQYKPLQGECGEFAEMRSIS